MLGLERNNRVKILTVCMGAVLALAFVNLAACSSGSDNGGASSEAAQEESPKFRLTKATIDGEWQGKYTDLADVNGYSWVTSYERESGDNTTNATYMGTSDWSFEYDSAGNLISRTWTNDHGATGDYQWTYDANGNQLTETSSVDGEVQSSKERSYDENGVINSEVSDSSLGHVETSYDEHGNPVQVDTESNFTAATTDGAVSEDHQTYEYEYDENGNVLVERSHHETGFLTSGAEDSTTTRTYDDEGRKLTESVSYDNGALKMSYTQEWAYDDAGHLIYETDPGNKTETTSTYDDEGNPLTKTMTATEGNYHPVGTVLEETTWDYDENGHLIRKKTETTEYGTFETTIESYTYDEDGLLSYKERIKDGKSQWYYTYEYYPDGNKKVETKGVMDVYLALYTSEFDEEGNLSKYTLSRPDGYYGPLSIAFEYERI